MRPAGHPAPEFNFAASSALARQIEQGGEADVFLSADEAWMDYVADKQLIVTASRRTLLTNTLVLVAPATNPMSITIASGMDLAGALKGGKLALADPIPCRPGNTQKRRWNTLEPGRASRRASRGAENARAALRLVEAGDAAAGIVYATDAKAAGPSVFNSRDVS